MEEIGIRELKSKASEVIKHVREEGSSYAITYRGKVVAVIEPASSDGLSARDQAVLDEMERLGRELAAKWPAGVTAVEAVREQRRDL